MISYLLNDDERAECERLGLECNFNPDLPHGGVDSAWRIDGKSFAFCDDRKERGNPVVYLCVERKKASVGIDDDALDRVWFIRRVCQRIVDEGGCRRSQVASDREKAWAVAEYQGGASTRAIARQLNRHHATVLAWAKAAGVFDPSRCPAALARGGGQTLWTAAELRRMVQLRAEGKKFTEIARILGRTHGSVRTRHSRFQREGR